MLTRYYPKKKVRKERLLIGGAKNATAEEEEKPLTKEELEIEVRSLCICRPLTCTDTLAFDHQSCLNLTLQRRTTPIVSYWHPNITLAIVSDRGDFPLASAPPETKKCKSRPALSTQCRY